MKAQSQCARPFAPKCARALLTPLVSAGSAPITSNRSFDQMISSIYNEFLYQGLNAKKENFLKLLNLDYESNFLLDLCIKKKIYEIKKSLRNRDN